MDVRWFTDMFLKLQGSVLQVWKPSKSALRFWVIEPWSWDLTHTERKFSKWLSFDANTSIQQVHLHYRCAEEVESHCHLSLSCLDVSSSYSCSQQCPLLHGTEFPQSCLFSWHFLTEGCMDIVGIRMMWWRQMRLPMELLSAAVGGVIRSEQVRKSEVIRWRSVKILGEIVYLHDNVSFHKELKKNCLLKEGPSVIWGPGGPFQHPTHTLMPLGTESNRLQVTMKNSLFRRVTCEKDIWLQETKSTLFQNLNSTLTKKEGKWKENEKKGMESEKGEEGHTCLS